MENKTNQNNISKDYSNMRFRDIPKEERKKVYKEARENGKYKNNKSITATANNLKPLNERTEEEAREIRRKGAEATNRLKGERKNAKQILEELLPLYANENAIQQNELIPTDIKDKLLANKNIKVTQYHLIMLSMMGKAMQGDVKASEYISNHFGDVVVKETHNVNESISEADKQLINNLKDRLNIVDAE